MQSLSPLPSFSPFLERYLGETPEWEFIARDDEHLLPFKAHRDRLCKQRVRAKHVLSQYVSARRKKKYALRVHLFIT